MGNGTQLGAVRGLGSSGHGADHWLKQRTSAVGNLLLMAWFIFSLLRLPNYEHGTFVFWLQSPFAAVPLALLVLSVFSHLRIGVQVFIEDYVQDEGLKYGAIIALTFFTYGVAGTALFAIAKIAFAGAA